MKKIYKVSLFDDSIPDRRTEIGLITNGGFVLLTQDIDKAEKAFGNELLWLNKYCKHYSLDGKRKAITVNICSCFGFDEAGAIWHWERQSHDSYIL